MTEPYAIEIGELNPIGSAAPYSMNEYFPASARRVESLSWSYTRPGGCGQLQLKLRFPYDKFGLSYQDRTGFRQFNHLVLRIKGTIWWQGYVHSIQPSLEVPERVSIVARGYSQKCSHPTVTWRFSRRGLKLAGDIGEIPGVVRGMYHLAPLLLGTEPDMPNPIGDTATIDDTAVLLSSLVFEQVTLWDIFSELATLAGNYDWGVDENRRFYFLRPQSLTANTAEYTANPGVSTWSDDGAGGYYGDETYADPQAVPPFLEVENTAVFVVGRDVRSFNPDESADSVRNLLVVYAAPKKAGDPVRVIEVPNPEWIDYWGEILRGRIATPFFSEDGDIRKWAQQRLRLTGRPQLRGQINAPHFERLVHPLGAARLIHPDSGNELIERILEVAYSLTPDGTLNCATTLGYNPPPDSYFAEHLRRDATLGQNAAVQQETPFILQMKAKWPEEVGWTATLA